MTVQELIDKLADLTDRHNAKAVINLNIEDEDGDEDTVYLEIRSITVNYRGDVVIG